MAIHESRGNAMKPPALGLTLFVARGPWQRLLGLHAYPRLKEGQGLWLAPCRAIHTFGLSHAIDVLFLDSSLRQARRIDRLGPGRIAWCLRAHSVVELPAGYCADNPRHLCAVRDALSAQSAGHP